LVIFLLLLYRNELLPVFCLRLFVKTARRINNELFLFIYDSLLSFQYFVVHDSGDTSNIFCDWVTARTVFRRDMCNKHSGMFCCHTPSLDAMNYPYSQLCRRSYLWTMHWWWPWTKTVGCCCVYFSCFLLVWLLLFIIITLSRGVCCSQWHRVSFCSMRWWFVRAIQFKKRLFCPKHAFANAGWASSCLFACYQANGHRYYVL